VRVSPPQSPDPEDAETAPELPPLDSLFEPEPELEPSAFVSDSEPAFDALPGAALDPDIAPVSEEPSAREPSQGLEPRVILRALAQLLVEKGVITRDEFAERLRSIASQERSRRQT
jgi:hypothetical protein